MPNGFIGTVSGNLVRAGTAGCLHASDWTSEMANVVGCDGYELNPQVAVVEGSASGVVAEIVMPSTALFAFDSAELTEEGKTAVNSNREALLPELEEAYAALIVGHSDSTGDATYNKDLSTRRAQSVRDYLVETGAPADKLRVLGLSADDQLASNDTDEGRAENRRVEAIVIGELRGLDTVMFPSAAFSLVATPNSPARAGRHSRNSAPSRGISSSAHLSWRLSAIRTTSAMTPTIRNSRNNGHRRSPIT